MYWHGSLENTRRTVEKIIADRAKRILVITGIGSTPCPMEGLKSTLDFITLNKMSFGPEEEFFIDARVYQCPPRVKRGVPRLYWWMGRKPSPRVMKHSSVGLRRCPCGSCLSPRRGRRRSLEGPYQDRPPLCPFRLLPLPTCS